MAAPPLINRRFLVTLTILIVITIPSIPLLLDLGERFAPSVDSQAVNGQVDISGIYGSEKRTRLTGEWEFYPFQLLDESALSGSEALDTQYIEVPGLWNELLKSGEGKTGTGYGTYHLKVSGAEAGKSLSMYVPTTACSVSVSIDEKVMYTSGTVASSRGEYRASYKTGVFDFVPEHTSFDLIVQISNYDLAYGGMWYALSIGQTGVMNTFYNQWDRKQYIFFGGYLVIYFFYTVIYLLRRKDISHLYFSMVALSALLRLTVSELYLIYHALPFIPFYLVFRIEYIASFWVSGSYLLLVDHLFIEEKILNRINRVVIRGICAVSALTLMLPTWLLSYLHDGAELIVMVVAGYGVALSFLASQKKHPGGTLHLAGSFFALLFAFPDFFLTPNYLTGHFGNLINVGLFGAILLQLVVIAANHARNVIRLEAMGEDLLRLDKLKDDFLENTSHELKTPLSGVLAISEGMLKGGDGWLTEGQTEKLELISSSVRRLAFLVNDILDISRLQHEDLVLDIKPVRIEGILRSTFKVFETLSIPRDISISLQMPETVPLVMADENRIAQILYNLLGNALKYTQEGSILLSLEERKGRVVIMVSDTGNGIPEDQIEEIFLSHFRSDVQASMKEEGHGIGLAVSKKLIEQQGGRIWVESTLGQGSTFFITLPIAYDTMSKVAVQPDREIVKRQRAIPSASHTVTSKEELVLIVDDEPINLEAASSLLQADGYSTVKASGGEEALRLLHSQERHTFSLVILDVMMPDLSGYEVCRKIREEWNLHELPILIMTVKNRVEDKVEALKAGANDFLSKPFESTEFTTRVNNLIELKSSVIKALNAELAFLQAQIKPHFLFNAMNTIISFCYTDGEKAAELLTSLGEFLRGSFDFKNRETLVPIEQELDFVRAFTRIEQARFGSRLEIIYDVDEDLQVLLPPLVIQPLVENAILHGVRRKKGKGTITITMKAQDDQISIAVSDDGVGIENDRIPALFEDGNQRVGLSNINSRLMKIYGRRVKLESTVGEGTKVSFLIPNRKEGETT